MTSRTGHGHGHGHAAPHAQGSWVRSYEAVDFDVPLLDPHARVDSDEEVEERDEGEEKERMTSMSASQQPPPTPPKDTRRNPSSPLASSPSKISPLPSSSSSSNTTSSSSSKAPPNTPPKPSPRAVSTLISTNANASHPDAPISISDDQRLAMPARAYASGDTRGAAVGSRPASISTSGQVAPGPDSVVAGLSAEGSGAGALPRSVNYGVASRSPLPGGEGEPGQGGVARGASLLGSTWALGGGGRTGTAPSSAGMTATKTGTSTSTSTQRTSPSYGSGDLARSGNFGSIEGLGRVGQHQIDHAISAPLEVGDHIQLQNIAVGLSSDFSFSSSSPSPASPPSSSFPASFPSPLSSSEASSSPAYFTPLTSSLSSPLVSQSQSQAQTQSQTRRSPPAIPHARPSSLTAAFRSSPLAHSQVTARANAMSASNSTSTSTSPSKKGDYVAVPPSSPGPAELTHAPSPPLLPPHSNSGNALPPSSSSAILGLPSFSSSTATVVAPPTPGMTTATSASTVPTLASTLSPSPSNAHAYAAPLARPAGGSVKAAVPPYPAQMQRVPSDGPDSTHTSARPSVDSGTMLRDHSYVPPPTFSHHAYPQQQHGPAAAAIPRPALHGSASRGSMILYRLSATEDGGLLPPHPGIGHTMNRSSVYSNSGDSIASLGQDSKYPLVGLGINHTGGSGANTPPTRMNTGGSGFSTSSTRPLIPLHPGTPGVHQGSIGSRGGSSLMFSEIGKSQGGLVAYAYDPDEDVDADELDEEEEEWVRMVGGRVVGGYFHSKDGNTIGQPEKASGKATPSTISSDPRPTAPLPSVGVVRTPTLKKKPVHAQTVAYKPTSLRTRGDFPWRGVMNISTIVVLISGLLCLFIVYPVTQVYTSNGVEARILGNTRINATGQAVGDFADVGGNGNSTNSTTAAVAAAGAAVASVDGKGKGAGVDKMDVGRREALDQLEVDARRRMERWEGLARVRGEQQ